MEFSFRTFLLFGMIGAPRRLHDFVVWCPILKELLTDLPFVQKPEHDFLYDQKQPFIRNTTASWKLIEVYKNSDVPSKFPDIYF